MTFSAVALGIALIIAAALWYRRGKAESSVAPEKYQKSMLNESEKGFVAFCKIVLQLLPKLLQVYFKQCWDTKYPDHLWQDLPENGELLIDGLLPCGVELPGTVKVRRDSGKVDTSEDLSSLLQEGDLVMIENQVFKVLNIVIKGGKKPKPKGFTISSKWKGDDMDGVIIHGQHIKCEKKIPKPMGRVIPKIKAGVSAMWDISILTMLLINSSHALMQGKDNGEVELVRKLRDVRNEQAHATEFAISQERLDDVCDLIRSFVALCLPEQLEWCEKEIAALRTPDAEESNIDHMQDDGLMKIEALTQEFKDFKALISEQMMDNNNEPPIAAMAVPIVEGAVGQPSHRLYQGERGSDLSRSCDTSTNLDLPTTQGCQDNAMQVEEFDDHENNKY